MHARRRIDDGIWRVLEMIQVTPHRLPHFFHFPFAKNYSEEEAFTNHRLLNVNLGYLMDFQSH